MPAIRPQSQFTVLLGKLQRRLHEAFGLRIPGKSAKKLKRASCLEIHLGLRKSTQLHVQILQTIFRLELYWPIEVRPESGAA